MPFGIIASLILHTILIAFFIFGMPKFIKLKNYDDTTVVVDVVDISEITNVKIKQAAKKKYKNITKSEAPKSQQLEQKSKEPPKDQKKAEQKKTKKIQDAEIIPDKSKPKKKIKQAEKPKNKTDKPSKKKVKDQSFEKSILKSVEEVQKKEAEKKIDKDFADLTDALKGKTDKDYNSNIPMSISEIDAIKSQITRNWNTTAFGGSNSMGMQVKVIIELDMQGNVTRINPKRQHNSSPYYASFVESALRAIKMTSPLTNLNPDKYSQWKIIEFNFDSEGMIY